VGAGGAARRSRARRRGVGAGRRGNSGSALQPAAARLGDHAAAVVSRADHGHRRRPVDGAGGGRTRTAEGVAGYSHHRIVRYHAWVYEFRDLPGVRENPPGCGGHHRIPRAARRHGHRRGACRGRCDCREAPSDGVAGVGGARGRRRRLPHARRGRPAEPRRRWVGGGGRRGLGRLHRGQQGRRAAAARRIRPGHRHVRGSGSRDTFRLARGGLADVPSRPARGRRRHRPAFLGHPLLA